MDQIKELQEQIEALKKTVSDLQNGTIKVVPLKVTISQKEIEIFSRYFVSAADACKTNNECCYRAMNREYLRDRLRDLVREIFKVNIGKPQENILKILREEQYQKEYFELYEKMCKFVDTLFQNNWLRKDG